MFYRYITFKDKNICQKEITIDTRTFDFGTTIFRFSEQIPGSFSWMCRINDCQIDSHFVTGSDIMEFRKIILRNVSITRIIRLKCGDQDFFYSKETFQDEKEKFISAVSQGLPKGIEVRNYSQDPICC